MTRVSVGKATKIVLRIIGRTFSSGGYWLTVRNERVKWRQASGKARKTVSSIGLTDSRLSASSGLGFVGEVSVTLPLGDMVTNCVSVVSFDLGRGCPCSCN